MSEFQNLVYKNHQEMFYQNFKTQLNSVPSPWSLFFLQKHSHPGSRHDGSFPLPYLTPTTVRNNEELGGE